MMKRLALLMIFACQFIMAWSQDKTISGRVTAFGELPVGNYEVKAKKAKSFTVTDSTGYFSIRCAEKDILLFQGKPFVPARIQVEGLDSVHINLVFIPGPKSEEIVVDMGYMRPGDIAYGLNQLSDRNNDFYTYNTVFDLIKGKFSNVEISSDNKIYIRGQVQSFNSDYSALLIVNGLEVQDISGIQPIDIASIEVLKGTEASIYGSRGAHGVIIIKLK